MANSERSAHKFPHLSAKRRLRVACTNWPFAVRQVRRQVLLKLRINVTLRRERSKELQPIARVSFGVIASLFLGPGGRPTGTGPHCGVYRRTNVTEFSCGLNLPYTTKLLLSAVSSSLGGRSNLTYLDDHFSRRPTGLGIRECVTHMLERKNFINHRCDGAAFHQARDFLQLFSVGTREQILVPSPVIPRCRRRLSGQHPDRENDDWG